MAFEVLVRFRDCDPAGIVFYGNLFDWFDDALWQTMREIAAEQGTTVDGLLFPLATVTSSFRSAIRWNQNLWIETATTEIGRSSFTVKHTARVDGQEMATCFEKRIFCRRDGDKLESVPIPAAFRAGLQQRMEG